MEWINGQKMDDRDSLVMIGELPLYPLLYLTSLFFRKDDCPLQHEKQHPEFALKVQILIQVTLWSINVS